MSFTEALPVFRDPIVRIFQDQAHSGEEPREIIIGHSAPNKLLLVCFTATKREQHDYEEHVTNQT